MTQLVSAVIPQRGFRNRTGITLMEVLISMFVIMVGLLGVAATLTLGRFENADGAKLDRAAAIGRMVLRDFKVRNYLHWRNWCFPDGTAVSSAYPNYVASDTATPDLLLNPVVIDPLGVGDGNPKDSASLGNYFPYGEVDSLPSSGSPPPPQGSNNPTDSGRLITTHLRRLTLFPTSLYSISTAQRAVLADHFFRANDDLVVENPTDEVLYPVQLTNSTGTKRQYQGDYSWMVTIAADSGVGANNTATVSVVVFYKRKIGADPELSTAINSDRLPDRKIFINGEGIGSAVSQNGARELVLSGNSALSEAENNSLLRVKAGGWIMLLGTRGDGDGDGLPDGRVLRWYRVAGVGESESGSRIRRVTLANCDWPLGLYGQWAYLSDEIVGVYQKNFRFHDLNSWTP